MVRKTAGAATAETREPKDAYDKLPQAEADAHDSIAAHGFRPERSGVGWAAEPVSENTAGFERTPPFPTLVELEKHVLKLFVQGPPDFSMIDDGDKDGESDGGDELDDVAGIIDGEPVLDDEASQIELETDTNGQGYMPGMAPVVDEHIASAAREAKALNNEWKEAGKKRTKAYTELAAICHTKPHLFTPDPENSNARIYRIGDLVIRLKNEVKEKVEVDEIDVAGD